MKTQFVATQSRRFAGSYGRHRALIRFVACLVLFGVADSCGRVVDSGSESEAPRPEWAVGEFGSMFDTRLELELEASGEYRGGVWSGNVTADGCAGPFVGDGSSYGCWRLAGEEIVFEPSRETSRLSISLVDAVGSKAPGGLNVVAGGKTYFLPRVASR